MPVLTIEDLEALRESVDVEFKKAAGQFGKGELPKEFWPTYSAMANTDGGEIYLGVEEIPGGRLRTIDVRDWQHVRMDIFNLANNRQKVSACLLEDADVVPITIGQHMVLKVRVPRAPRRQRPVYVGENPLKGTYVRRNEGDFHLDDASVRRMLAEQTEESRDSMILPHFDIDDLDIDTLDAYRSVFAARDSSHPFVRQPLSELLRSLNAFRKDRETGEEGLTLAGLLMFGKLNSILEAVPNYILDYQERAEARTEVRWVDRVTTDGSWSGNLFDFYTKVFTKLTSELKVPYRNEGGVRKLLTPVHEALQEALVNTLIHADYGGRVSIFVVKRPDMFGFRNPGLMRIPFELAKRGGNSDCRNRLIQKMFQLAGAGDQAGSGVPRIYGVWKTQSWREPVAYEKRDPEQTLFELRMASLLPHEEIARFEEKYGDGFRRLSHDDKVVLVSAALEAVIDHRRACELTDQHPADVTKQLGRLSRDGFLQPDGRGRGTYYWSAELNETERMAVLDGHLGGLVGAELANPLALGVTPQPPAASPLENDFIHEELARLYPSGVPKRLQDSDMRELILRLLSHDFVTLRSLAEVVNRSPEFIRQQYVKPLLDDGNLQLRFPDNPSHPNQAYRRRVG